MQKTRKSERVSRIQLHVTWEKGDEQPKADFQKAVDKVAGNGNEIMRRLIEAWTKLILARKNCDIEVTAKKVMDDYCKIPKASRKPVRGGKRNTPSK